MQWGKDMLQGFINGIKSMLGNIGEAAKNVGNKIKEFLHFTKPDRGPLREYEKWMPDMIKGLSSSMEKATPKLYNASKELAEKVANGFNLSNAFDNLKEAVDLETAKLNTNLTTSGIVQVERNDDRQAILKSIDDNKEITVNSVTKLDGNVLTRTVNKVNAKRKLQYGY